MSEELSDGQRGMAFTHQVLAVREALLKNSAVRKRVLALILHEKVRSEAMAVRHEANGVNLHADRSEGFDSAPLTRLKEQRAKVDPFIQKTMVEDVEGYEQLGKLAPAKLDALIELLTVECLTAHLLRRTELICHLAEALKVNVREAWRPDAKWLASYQKQQLAHLLIELKGPVHAPSPERKKSELVEALVSLFADAADGKLEDKKLAERVNTWLPICLRQTEGKP